MIDASVMKTKAAVIIPNWNGEDMIKDCISSLLLQSTKPQIIVVDNGSEDNSISIIRSFADVELLEFKDNAGFAGGVNRGIKYALDKGFEYIALFNNDAVADKDWLNNLLIEAEADIKNGIITGKFMRSDKKHIDSTGDFYTIWGLPFPRGRNQLDTGQYDIRETVFGATGGASLYRAALFEDIGIFDEDFFAYYEDVDISFRAQMAGWKVVYTPKAKAYHGLGGTSSKMGDFTRYHSAKNFLLLYARNMPTKLCFKYCLLFSLQFLRMLLSSIIRGKLRAFAKGTYAALKLHKNTVRVRKNNLAKQRVGNEYIDSLLIKSRPPRIPTIE